MRTSRKCLECGVHLPEVASGHHGVKPGFCSTLCRRSYRKQYHKQWWTANRARELAKLSERNEAHKQKNPEYWSEHYQKYRDQIFKRARAWYKANKDRAAETCRAYDLAHPELIRRLSRKSAGKRRAIKKQVFVETVDPQVVFDRDHGMCGICKTSVDPASRWEIDHVIPISKGGAHGYGNVQLAHRQCNRAKGATMPDIKATSLQVVA